PICLGGDEFVALLPEVADERDAERVAARILDLMREPIFVGGQECFVTASVGSALHKALERGELVLHYQPKVDVRGAKMVGAEALMRWRHNGVLVPPADFIP